VSIKKFKKKSQMGMLNRLVSDIKVSFKTSYFLIFLTTLAVATRFYKIDSESLWLDEAFSFWISGLHGNIKNLWTYIIGSNVAWWDPHPFFYYLVLHYWIKLLGTSEFVLRSLSALCGVLTILCTYHIGNRFFNQKTGMLASILVFMSPLNLWYSQEARMYTLTSLLILLSIYFFFALITAHKRWVHPIFYILSSIILIYTDYIGILVIMSQVLFVFCYVALFKKHTIKVFLWCYCILFLLYIPWLPHLYHMAGAGGGTHLPTLTIWSGLKVLLFFMVDAGVDDFQAALLPLVSSAAVKVMIGVAGLACWIMYFLGGILSFRTRSATGIFLTVICCIPVTLFILSKSIMPIFCSKQISGFVPEVALLIAVGFVYASGVCARLKLNFLYRMLIATLILVISINIYNFYVLYHYTTKENWRDTARYVEKNLHKNDTIILLPNAQGPFQYYMRENPGIKSVNDIQGIQALSQTHAECWLIYSDMDKRTFETEINKYLNNKAHDITRRKFNGTSVVFYKTL
jgi:uncharacterized membrane protein